MCYSVEEEDQNIEQTEDSNEKTVGFEDDWVTVNPADVAGADAEANKQMNEADSEEAEREPEDEPEEEIIVNGKLIVIENTEKKNIIRIEFKINLPTKYYRIPEFDKGGLKISQAGIPSLRLNVFQLQFYIFLN